MLACPAHRLAMVAFIGFIGQHAATGKSPLEALGEHVANPWAVNFATNGVSIPGLFAEVHARLGAANGAGEMSEVRRRGWICPSSAEVCVVMPIMARCCG
eukprot:363891-Chlamydomonas_euryale.AAC.5